MSLHPTLHDAAPLAVDPEATVATLCRFLQSQLMRVPRRRGYVIGISGGIDSALAAALCARAVGCRNVTAVLLPERESQPDGVQLARRLVDHLQLPSVEIDLTDALELLDVYAGRERIVREIFGRFEPQWRYRLVLPGDLHQSRALNVYRIEVVRPDGSREFRRPDAGALRRLQALTNVKQRLRMAVLYREAESRAYLVCGTTNRTEAALGFFVRHGDAGVDVEPLADLYKTQVRALSVHLGLPRAVVERPPAPDTWSAPVNDAEFYLRLDYGELDAVLARVQRGQSVDSIACDLSMEPAMVERVVHEISRRDLQSARGRELPPTPARDSRSRGA